MCRRRVEILVEVNRVVDQQMAGENLTEHTLALVTRASNGFERLLARVMHDV